MNETAPKKNKAIGLPDILISFLVVGIIALILIPLPEF